MSAAFVDPPSQSEAAPDHKLASSDRLGSQGRWDQIIDQLLRWLQSPESIGYEEFDLPTAEIIKSATDFCHDVRVWEWPLPSGFGPSVDGGITFEWRANGTLVHLELFDIGRAEVTEIHGEDVVDHYTLTRDPLHRGWLKRQAEPR